MGCGWGMGPGDRRLGKGGCSKFYNVPTSGYLGALFWAPILDKNVVSSWILRILMYFIFS